MTQSMSLLSRKMHQARQTFEATKMTRASGFSDAVKRIFHKEFGASLDLKRHVEFCEDQSKLLKRLESFNVVALFSNSQSELVLVALNAPAASSILQYQTLGSAPRPRVQEWHITSTEGALLSPICEKILGEYTSERMPAGEGPEHQAELKFISSDRSVLALMLEKGAYEIVETIFCGEGEGRDQRYLLACSVADQGEQPLHKHPTVEQALLRVETEFRAILARLCLGVEEVKGMEIGQTFVLDRAALNKGIAISPEGHVVHEVHLGKINKLWAMRFVEDTAVVQDTIALENLKRGEPEVRPVPVDLEKADIEVSEEFVLEEEL